MGVEAFRTLSGDGLFDSPNHGSVTWASAQEIVEKILMAFNDGFCWSSKKGTTFTESQEIIGLFF